MSSLVTSHIDYGNALLAGVNNVVINKYQRVWNIAVKVILNIGRIDVLWKLGRSYIDCQYDQE